MDDVPSPDVGEGDPQDDSLVYWDSARKLGKRCAQQVERRIAWPRGRGLILFVLWQGF